MFRKILIAAVASLSLLSPFALPTETQAYDRNHRENHHHEFRVYFRECNRDAWRFAGTYRNREEAWRVAHRYQERGFETSVR
jgi:hypothetical protein